MKKINEESINNLTSNEAIVLQQIYEDGEDDVRTLAQMLGMSAKSVVAVVAHLKKRGLVAISNDLGDLSKFPRKVVALSKNFGQNFKMSVFSVE